jgi:phosphocarrier protein HPr
MLLDSASTQVTIINKLGLHARPAMSFVDTASTFKSEIKVTKESQTVDGKSIMQLMMLAAPKGSELRIDARGPDAQQAVDALIKLVASKFDEE